MRCNASIRLSLFLLPFVCLWGCSDSFSNPSPKNDREPVADSSFAIDQRTPLDDDLGPVGDFSFTERSGQTIGRADLRGKVWVASFLFTRCCTGCPQITATLAQLQKELQGQRDVILVSFSVDPEHDTPKVLKDYAKEWGADPKRWLFLTGKQEDIYRLIKDSFHLAVQQNEGGARTPGNEVTHSNRLVVVDKHGRIRGLDFDGTNAEELSRLSQKIDALLREKP
jgi:cytochrome oxidase Cu insertion factor (SCO1/SenC/PrrC family)